MGYVEGVDVKQMMMTSWDDMVDPESIARLIDAFVDSLNLQELGFQKASPAEEGRPAYDPGSLLKLYLYGARSRIRSSRRLAHSCQVNLEVIWLVKAVQPDFRTVSDFRRDNIDSMKKVFLEFNQRLAQAAEAGFQSVDGSKFRAWNSKDRNFTLSKLDDRIKRMEAQTEEYLRQLDAADAAGGGEGEPLPGHFTKEELEKRLGEIAERKEKYESCLKYMQENGLSQLSLTDREARLMKTRDGWQVSYNVQTSVDSSTHLITNFEVTDHPADNGLLGTTLEPLREDGRILESVADKGYQQPEDMVECLEKGIIPNVIPPEGRDSYELEVPYVPCENAEELRGKQDGESLKKCMESGTVPDVYADIIKDMEVIERDIRVYDTDTAADGENAGTDTQEAEGQLRVRAAEGYFVRNLEEDYVVCPAGAKLRKKSTRKNGAVRYCNKLACKNCRHKDQCMKSISKKYPWKEVGFRDKVTEMPCRTWDASCGQESQEGLGVNYHYEKRKTVRMKFYPNRAQMAQRMNISEHPFGTLKRAMEGSYFLLKGIRKVTGEFALLSLGYNLIRGLNILGFQKMMAVMGR